MKKLFAITALIFATLMLSCEKEPDPIPQTIEDLKDASDFNGEWAFVKLYVQSVGDNITDCSSPYSGEFWSMSFKDSKCTITEICTGSHFLSVNEWNVTYYPNDKNLEISSPETIHVFGIKVESFNNGVLVLSRKTGDISHLEITLQRQ